jgi:quinolinate synthase
LFYGKNGDVLQRISRPHELIVVTEAGLLHRLRKEIPHKTFIPGPMENCFCGECRFMKMNTLEKAYDALSKMEPEIVLPEPLRKRAEAPILRMLELSR